MKSVMRKALDKLCEERDALSACVEGHRALMAPIRRLPLDILEHIFIACLPTHRNCVMSAQEAPVILGRICSSWRNILLSTPRLWCRLHIVDPSPDPDSLNTLTVPLSEAMIAERLQRLEVANTWLRRSGKCPLSISLEGRVDQPTFHSESLPASVPKVDLFSSALVSFASRWQNIRLDVEPRALEPLSRLTEHDVPLLKQFEVVAWDTASSRWTQSGVLRGPSLFSFSISGRRVKSSDLPLRWSQLTALYLSADGLGGAWGMGMEQTSQVLLDILSRCPNLQTCSLLVDGPPEEDPIHPIVECPSLHTLYLFCATAPLHTSGYLLSHLSLPDLRELTLRGQTTPGDSRMAGSLVSCLCASPRLNIISIDSETFTNVALTDFIRGLPPTIQRLHIREPPGVAWRPDEVDPVLDDDVLATLGTVCPAVKELVVLNCTNVSDEAILRFISRMPALQRVHIHFGRERQVDILPSIQPFVDNGLKSTLTYITIPRRTRFSPWKGLPDAPQPNWQGIGFQMYGQLP